MDDNESKSFFSEIGLEMADDYDDDDGDLLEVKKHKIAKKRDKSIWVTPAGIIPITEHNDPEKCFQLVWAHTNFDISERIAKNIEVIPGVEALYVWSRYRMMIGFGKVFNVEDVKIDIELACNVIDQYPLAKVNPPLWNDVFKLRERLSRKPLWAIYVLPNCKVHAINSDMQGEAVFRKELQTIRETQDAVGGYVYASED